MSISTNYTFAAHPWGPELQTLGDPIAGTWEVYGEQTGNGTGGTITARLLLAGAASGQPYSMHYYSLNKVAVVHDDTVAQVVKIKPWSSAWEALYNAAVTLYLDAPEGLYIDLPAGQTHMKPTDHTNLALPIYLGRAKTASGTGGIDVVWSTNTDTKHYGFHLSGFYWTWVPARWLYANSLA